MRFRPLFRLQPIHSHTFKCVIHQDMVHKLQSIHIHPLPLSPHENTYERKWKLIIVDLKTEASVVRSWVWAPLEFYFHLSKKFIVNLRSRCLVLQTNVILTNKRFWFIDKAKGLKVNCLIKSQSLGGVIHKEQSGTITWPSPLIPLICPSFFFPFICLLPLNQLLGKTTFA